MLAVNPNKFELTTATTPTPIGCKLLKINRLAHQLSLASPFREVRILQNLQNASTHNFEMVAGAGFEPTTFGL